MSADWSKSVQEAVSLIRNESTDDAIEILRRLEEQVKQKKGEADPTVALVLLFQGIAHLFADRPNKAEEPLRRARQHLDLIFDDFIRDRLRLLTDSSLGTLALLKHDHSMARTFFEKATSLYEQDPRYATLDNGIFLLALGELFLASDEIPAAQKVIERALSFDSLPTTMRAQGLVRLGELTLRAKDYEYAKDIMENALNLCYQPEDPPSLHAAVAAFALAESLRALDYHEPALVNFELGTDIVDGLPKKNGLLLGACLVHIAYQYSLQGKQDKVEELYLKALVQLDALLDAPLSIFTLYQLTQITAGTDREEQFKDYSEKLTSVIESTYEVKIKSVSELENTQENRATPLGPVIEELHAWPKKLAEGTHPALKLSLTTPNPRFCLESTFSISESLDC